MAESVTVGDLMKPAATTVEREAHVAAAAYLMKQDGGSALVVTTNDEARTPVAVVTEADVAQAVADGKDVERTRINELRTSPIIISEPGAPVSKAAELMVTAQVGHLLVMDDDRLVGMLTMADACQGLLRAAATVT